MEKSVTKLRHLAKAVTWRIVASIITTIIAFWFGVEPKTLGFVFAVDLVLKLALYYAHERIWYKNIKFGIKNV